MPDNVKYPIYITTVKFNLTWGNSACKIGRTKNTLHRGGGGGGG